MCESREYRPVKSVMHLPNHVNDANNLSTTRFYSGDGMFSWNTQQKHQTGAGVKITLTMTAMFTPVTLNLLQCLNISTEMKNNMHSYINKGSVGGEISILS